MGPDFRDQKAALRKEGQSVRARLAKITGATAGEALAAHMLGCFQENGLAGPISAYWPGAGEMDCRLLLGKLDESGFICCLPVVQDRGQPLIFRRWRRGDVLVRDRYGLENPEEDKEEVVPSVILAPMVAFDAAGNRLGQGGGFYDRTIAGLRKKRDMTVIGITFAGQEVDRVPVDVYDEPLDAVATEQGIRWFNKDGS